MSTKIGDVTISVDGPYVVMSRGDVEGAATVSASYSPAALAAILVQEAGPETWMVLLFASEGKGHWDLFAFESRDEAEVFASAIRHAALEAGQWRRG